MNDETNTPASERKRFRYQKVFFKANMKGTGGALKLALHPAHDSTDGSIWATFAKQMTIGDRHGPTPIYPRFDWDNAICVKLNFDDLSKILQVFRGYYESLEEETGLIHQSPRGRTQIQLRHVTTETDSHYAFAVQRISRNGQTNMSANISLSEYEVLGLTAAIENMLGVICFGIPMVIERDVTAYKQATREVRHVPAVSA